MTPRVIKGSFLLKNSNNSIGSRSRERADRDWIRWGHNFMKRHFTCDVGKARARRQAQPKCKLLFLFSVRPLIPPFCPIGFVFVLESFLLQHFLGFFEKSFSLFLRASIFSVCFVCPFPDTKTERESGRKAQLSNISAAKVPWTLFVSVTILDWFGRLSLKLFEPRLGPAPCSRWFSTPWEAFKWPMMAMLFCAKSMVWYSCFVLLRLIWQIASSVSSCRQKYDWVESNSRWRSRRWHNFSHYFRYCVWVGLSIFDISPQPAKCSRSLNRTWSRTCTQPSL